MPICWLPFWKIQILRQKASTFRYTYILIISKWSAVGSVSDPYSLNPDPAKNLNPDPDPKHWLLEKNPIKAVVMFYLGNGTGMSSVKLSRSGSVSVIVIFLIYCNFFSFRNCSLNRKELSVLLRKVYLHMHFCPRTSAASYGFS